MSEKILRSPFMMMVMLVMFGIVYIGFQEGLEAYIFYYPFLLFFIIYFALVAIHNQKHPQRKIKVFTFIPYELQEDDEGWQYYSYRAMRKIYIFYYFAIPLAIVCTVFFQDMIPHFTIILLVLLGVVQYFIYWLEIRKVSSRGDLE